MNREEYLRLLAIALKDIPQAEKEEALQYYNDYFDDAGIENEQDVINSLGSPAKLAESIQREFADGYGKFENCRNDFQGYNPYVQPYQDNSKRKNKLSGGVIALIVVLCILASPLLLALAAVAVSIVIAIFAAFFALIMVLFAVVLTLVCVGIVCVSVAFALGLSSPFSAALLIGICIASIGVCIFLVMAIVWLFGVALPWLLKGIGKLFKKIFGKKGDRI